MHKENKIIGCALGVLENNILGLYNISIDHEYRNNGYGKDLTKAIINWGIENGAKTAYLQATVDNVMANSIYKQLGFVEYYKYWYRVKTIA